MFKYQEDQNREDYMKLRKRNNIGNNYLGEQRINSEKILQKKLEPIDTSNLGNIGAVNNLYEVKVNEPYNTESPTADIPKIKGIYKAKVGGNSTGLDRRSSSEMN